jgi:diadenosine tetraphosphate (Ap4A) HIT family hydrolase
MGTRGWPADWDARKAGADCPMCAAPGGRDDEHALAVATLPWTHVGLHRRSLLPGYCVVAWRHGHVADPTELDEEAAAGYFRDVLAVGRAIEAELHPVKLNLMTLGNWVPHLHTHVVPRYADDPAPGGPLAWDQMFTPEPDEPEALRRLAAAIGRRLVPPPVG